MEDIKVSAIIPFYNGVEWLCEAVQSVLDQTYKNIEIVVVNDGSPEDVTPFLEKYGDKVKYIYQENKGSAAARNKAIANATGEYYALLDSDDIWFPEKTELQLAFMEQSGAMWSHTGFNYWYPATGELTNVDVSENYGNVFKREFVSLRISTPSVMINAKCFQEHPEINFPEHMKYGQDGGCFMQLSKYYPLGLVDKPLMNVRLRGTNTNSRALVRIQVNVRTLNMILQDKSGFYNQVPSMALFIFKIYRFNGTVINRLSKIFKISHSSQERLAKLMWALPFVLERIFTFVLTKEATKGYSKYVMR